MYDDIMIKTDRNVAIYAVYHRSRDLMLYDYWVQRFALPIVLRLCHNANPLTPTALQPWLVAL